MPSLLNNKYVRFGLFGVGAIVLLAVLLVLLASLSNSRSVGFSMTKNQGMAVPGYGGAMMMDDMAREESYAPSMDGSMLAYDPRSSYYPGPTPMPPVDGGYTAGLEQFETTSYNLSARTRQFDALCDTLTTLKSDDAIHFKSLNESLNNCSAQFFVAEDKVAAVRAQFEAFSDVELTRTTNSVTRHRENIESRASIVRAQLETVETTLAEAQGAYDEIIALARDTRDAEALNQAIRNKLEQIDYLSQRKISLTSQLDSYAQQAADLEERLGVVEFYANFSRSYPVDLDETSRMWERAWEQLSDQVTLTLIGVTATFGIFLLYLVQYGLYLLVLLVVARFGWKLLQKVWKL